jgi:hypothetical protein
LLRRQPDVSRLPVTGQARHIATNLDQWTFTHIVGISHLDDSLLAFLLKYLLSK